MNNSQSQRILWLIEELGIEYNLVNHFRKQDDNLAPPELRKLHPLGKSPLLETGDGTVVSESSAIATYLLLKYDTTGKFGTGEKDILKITKDEELISFAGTTMGNLSFPELLLEMISSKIPWPLKYIPKAMLGGLRKGLVTPWRTSQLKCLEGELADKTWFSGNENPGRADFVLSFPLDVFAHRKWVNFDEYPKLKAWRERVLEREAWKRGLTKGNGYNLGAF